MRKVSTLYVTIFVLLAVVALFAYMLQRTSAPMAPATDRPAATTPGGG